MKIGTLTTGDTVQTAIDLTYVPQFIKVTPTTALKGVKVEIDGNGVPILLDTAGVAAQNSIRRISVGTNELVLMVADGLLKGKTCTITFTNSAAQTPDVFGWSNNEGSMYLQQTAAKALANSGVTIKKFGFAAFPSAAATDEFLVTFKSGVTQKFVRDELIARLGNTQALKNTASDYCIDNFDMDISEVQFLPAADQTVYVTRWAIASGTLNQKVL